jgi:cytidylate kinase
MTVITLSRQMGCHGEEIASSVAQALGLRFIDAAAINQAAQRAGVPQVALDELEHEGQRGLVNQMLKALRTMPGLPRTSPPAGAPAAEAGPVEPDSSGLPMPFSNLFSPTARPISASIDSYVRVVGMVVRGLARQGNVLILGRGGQVLLRNHPNAMHIQVVAPQPFRVDVVMSRLGLSKREALSRVRASDRARSDQLRRYHDADWLDPTLYDLVVNTGRVSVATAVDLIIAAQRARQQAREESPADELENAGTG